MAKTKFDKKLELFVVYVTIYHSRATFLVRGFGCALFYWEEKIMVYACVSEWDNPVFLLKFADEFDFGH